MRVSRTEINKNLRKEIIEIFCQLIADLKNPEEVRTFLDDLLSKTELEVIAKRVTIAHYLEKGRSYQNIKNNLKASSATIASVDKMRASKGFQLALRKIEAERWASEWAGKIEQLFKK